MPKHADSRFLHTCRRKVSRVSTKSSLRVSPNSQTSPPLRAGARATAPRSQVRCCWGSSAIPKPTSCSSEPSYISAAPAAISAVSMKANSLSLPSYLRQLVPCRGVKQQPKRKEICKLRSRNTTLHFTIPLNNPLSALTVQSQGIRRERKAAKIRRFRELRCLLTPEKKYGGSPKACFLSWGERNFSTRLTITYLFTEVNYHILK